MPNRTPAQTKWANASFIAANLNDFNTGWAFVQGSCGGANFTRGLGSPKKTCGRLTIKTSFSGASFTVGNWTLTVHGNYVYGRISGPQHRLDLAFKARGDAPTRSLPHGIIGQAREVPSPYATDFAFSRFEGAEASAPREALITKEASATERSE